MKIYNDFNIENKCERTITIGNFDGIHIGHKKLIEKGRNVANDNKQMLSILTFNIHTSNMKENKIKYICSKKQKLELFEKSIIDELFIVDFNENIKSMTTRNFIKDILIDKLNVKSLVLGDDAILGSDRLDIKNIAEICEEYGILFAHLNNVEIDGVRVTSTLIRNMLLQGVVGEELEKFLGREYLLEGKVIHGNSFGREIGFPTANIDVDDSLVIPKYGVYYGICEVAEKKYRAGINIGNKPSVENNFFSIEAFMIDFNEDIYGHDIKINLKEYLREEIKFNDMEELKKQIKSDIEYINENCI